MVAETSYKRKISDLFATPRNNKAGWFNTHNNQRILLQKTNLPMIIVEVSIASGLSRYPYVWKKYFPKSVNAGNVDIPKCTKIKIIHCGRNSTEHNRSHDISTGITKIA